MTTRKRMRSGRVLFLFSVCVFGPLGQPSMAAAQTFDCRVAAEPAEDAIAALKKFKLEITSADVLDLEDVQTAIEDALKGLADNVSGEVDKPSKLAELCERLDANELGVVIAEDDCTADSDGVTCDGAEVFSNYQDVIEGLGEDAVPQITNEEKVKELRDIIIADIYDAIRLLVQWAIDKAKASPTSGSASSDSSSIVDAETQRTTAEGQRTECLEGTTERACGDAVASFFDAWFNAIIVIIE